MGEAYNTVEFIFPIDSVVYENDCQYDSFVDKGGRHNCACSEDIIILHGLICYF